MNRFGFGNRDAKRKCMALGDSLKDIWNEMIDVQKQINRAIEDDRIEDAQRLQQRLKDLKEELKEVSSEFVVKCSKFRDPSIEEVRRKVSMLLPE